MTTKNHLSQTIGRQLENLKEALNADLEIHKKTSVEPATFAVPLSAHKAVSIYDEFGQHSRSQHEEACTQNTIKTFDCIKRECLYREEHSSTNPSDENV